MRHSSSPVCSLARLCGSAAVIALLASGLGGCKTTGSPEVTGALGAQAALPPEAESHRVIEAMGSRIEVDAPLIVLAGRNYRDPIWPAIACRASVPMEGLGIGKQLAWLNEN